MLRPRLRPRQVTLAPFDVAIDDEVLGGVVLTLRDDRVRLATVDGLLLNNEHLRRDTLLLVGDRVSARGRTWTVSS